VRVIDANTGFEPKIGDTFTNVLGRHTLLNIQEGFTWARALLRTTYAGSGVTCDIWVPLRVRYTHPSFFLQKVAFLPS